MEPALESEFDAWVASVRMPSLRHPRPEFDRILFEFARGFEKRMLLLRTLDPKQRYWVHVRASQLSLESSTERRYGKDADVVVWKPVA